MVKFIVVDDSKEFQRKIVKVIQKATNNKYDKASILTFQKYSGDLQKAMDDETNHKIYLLDVELEDSISGIQIAKKIRERDWDSEILFLTSHDKMFEIVYRSVYEVFDFIEKFHDMEERLAQDLKMILCKQCDHKMFTYHARNIDIQIYFKTILYIYREKNERKLVIVTDTNTFKICSTMTDIIALLDDRFQIVHRACIVNKDRVTKYDWSKGIFTLDNGVEVPFLSKKYKKGVEQNDVK